LASRFGVHGFPSFYVVDGWHAYYFDDMRTRRALVEYASGKYKETSPLPFYSSPMGPIGIIQGTVISAGLSVADLFQYLQEAWGLSGIVAGGLMFGSAFMSCFFAIVFLAIVVSFNLLMRLATVAW
jgi:hypothetical protein